MSPDVDGTSTLGNDLIKAHAFVYCSWGDGYDQSNSCKGSPEYGPSKSSYESSNDKGYFAVNLEVFSLLSCSEMKTFFTLNSPDPDQALAILKSSPTFKQESNGFVKAQISLLCGGSDHIMSFPVYGKNCTHIEVSKSTSLLTCSVWIYLVLYNKFQLDLNLNGYVRIVQCNARMIFLSSWIH